MAFEYQVEPREEGRKWAVEYRGSPLETWSTLPFRLGSKEKAERLKEDEEARDAQGHSSGKPLSEGQSTTLIPLKAQISRIRFWIYKHRKELYPWQQKLLCEEERRRATLRHRYAWQSLQ